MNACFDAFETPAAQQVWHRTVSPVLQTVNVGIWWALQSAKQLTVHLVLVMASAGWAVVKKCTPNGRRNWESDDREMLSKVQKVKGKQKAKKSVHRNKQSAHTSSSRTIPTPAASSKQPMQDTPKTDIHACKSSTQGSDAHISTSEYRAKQADVALTHESSQEAIAQGLKKDRKRGHAKAAQASTNAGSASNGNADLAPNAGPAASAAKSAATSCANSVASSPGLGLLVSEHHGATEASTSSPGARVAPKASPPVNSSKDSAPVSPSAVASGSSPVVMGSQAVVDGSIAASKGLPAVCLPGSPNGICLYIPLTAFI